MEKESWNQGCTSGIMGQDTAERPHQVRLGGDCGGGGDLEGGRVQLIQTGLHRLRKLLDRV